MIVDLEEHKRVGDLPHLIYQRTPAGGVRQHWCLRAHGVVAVAAIRDGVIRSHRKVRAKRSR